MTKDLKGILARAESWPEWARQDLADLADEIEQQLRGELYRPTPEELAKIDEGLAAADRGEFATDAEVEAAFAKFRNPQTGPRDQAWRREDYELSDEERAAIAEARAGAFAAEEEVAAFWKRRIETPGRRGAAYIALVHKDEGTSYGISFPDVPGCISAGDTFEDAIANAGEALAGHFAVMRADNEAIPAARSYDDLRHDPEFIADSEGAIVTVVTPRIAMAAAG